MLIKAGHPSERQTQRYSELRPYAVQVVRIETVLVHLDAEPRVAELHLEAERVTYGFRQAAQLGAAARDEHAADERVARLHPEELEGAPDLGGEFHQNGPQCVVNAAGRELFPLHVEVEEVLFVLGGDGGGAVLQLDLFGRIEVQTERTLDRGSEVVAGDVDVAVHQHALTAYQGDGGTAGCYLQHHAHLVGLREVLAGQGGLGQVLAKEGALE